jgi:type I restriction enzyme, S subunit
MSKPSFAKYKLRDCVADIIDNRGKNPHSYFLSEKYPVIDNYLIQNSIYPDLKKVKRFINQEIYDDFLRGYLEKDDVIITLVGNGICNVSLTPSREATIIQNTIGIKTNEKLDSRFLYYYFLHNQKALVKLDRGSSQPSINKNDLLDFEIEIPSIGIQRTISNIMFPLDAKIELNQRINAELEAMAKTLYDYWFVQFDFPNAKGKPYKSSGGKMVWNEKLNNKIPEDWHVKPLGKALKTNLGGTPSTKNAEYWENATIPWLNSGDIANFPVINSSSFITKKGVDNSATTILHKGSVVISLVRYIRPSIIAIDACANQSVVGIGESEELKNAFIYPYLVNEVPRLMKLRTGAQQPHINKETIDATLLCIPPANILNQYYKICQPIYQKIINLAFESQTLTELRDWLLPMLMNGQVKVK